MMQTLLTLTLVATCCSTNTIRATEGGYVDSSTGLVWSPSSFSLGLGQWDWNTAKTAAAGYAVWDENQFGVQTYYDDWRMPTVKELQQAILDGAIHAPLNPDGTPMWAAGTNYVWSSESKGNKGWAVSVVIDSSGHVIGGGSAILRAKTTSSDIFFVRP